MKKKLLIVIGGILGFLVYEIFKFLMPNTDVREVNAISTLVIYGVVILGFMGYGLYFKWKKNKNHK